MCFSQRTIAICVACLLGGTASAQVTRRISFGVGGVQANGDSDGVSITPDGRYILFSSQATNLIPGDTNGVGDVFVLDLQTGTMERVNVATGGAEAGGGGGADITPDGRFVLITSYAGDLVDGDTNSRLDAFVHDRWSGTTERVSIASDGTQGNDHSFGEGISDDGRFVVFDGWGTNLVPGDTNAVWDIFVRDRLNGTTERVSVDSNGVEGNDFSNGCAISPDGRYVAFVSLASNLVPGDTNRVRDVFLHDRQTGTTVRESVDPNGGEADGECYDSACFSVDGRILMFTSIASNLVPGGTNGMENVFLRDLQLNQTEVASLAWDGSYGNGHSFPSAISSDGRFVTFSSRATNLVSGDTNGCMDLFVRDRQSGTTERASVSSGGAQGNADPYGYSVFGGAVPDDGGFTVFSSRASNMVPGDTNAATDLFLRDPRPVPPAFTSLCEPGAGGVILCPCGNPPAGPGRGCDNSAGTGGAILAATGNTQLSADGLSFATSGEFPGTLSILAQATVFAPNGIVYGQGVRCFTGTIRRLYTKSADGGAILVPDFFAGEPPVSVRSESRGDTIQPGQSRWYFVFYRDPVVLGGCPATSTFNATQTGRVDWSL
jgi:Tol biopolymer transport system component